MITELDWQTTAEVGQEIVYSNLNTTFNYNTLQIIFDIDLEYVGNSFDPITNNYDLGTTYVIDFYSFRSYGNMINKPGNCQNRQSASFAGIDFNEFWSFSEYPYLSDQIGTVQTLSYPPPSSNWLLKSDSCDTINYKGTFSWNNLIQCQDYEGNNLVTVEDDGTAITLGGTLYVNIVSPYSMQVNDTGYYRSLGIIQQDFQISILKQINVLASTGVDLFIMSMLGFEIDDRIFRLSVLTQVADYMKVTNPNLLKTPFEQFPSMLFLIFFSEVNTKFFSKIVSTRRRALEVFEVEAVTSDCLVGSSFTCAQITIFSISLSCSNSSLFLNGDFSFGFEAQCRNVTQQDKDACIGFMDDNNGPNIALNLSTNFAVSLCPPDLYIFQASIDFFANIEFYDDLQFAQIHDGQNGDYVIGQDTIYVQVEVDFPNDGSGDNFDIFGVIIDNVFVCTADDNAALSVGSNQANGEIGCLSSKIDTDGLFNIITNGQPNDEYLAEIISSQVAAETSNIVQFSFLTFDVPRTTIYVHVQLTLILRNGERRRLQDIFKRNNEAEDTSSQIRHFLGSVGINRISELKTTEINMDADFESDFMHYLQITLIGIGIVLTTIILMVIILVIFFRKLKESKAEKIASMIIEKNDTTLGTGSV